MMVRRGYKRAIVAVAHNRMLRIVHIVLRDGTPYEDPRAEYESLTVSRNASRRIHMLRRQGFPEGDGTRCYAAGAALP